MKIQRIAAFSDGEKGGNPAGVVVLAELPEASVMQQVAAEVGYSETAFAAPVAGGWRVRYFAPEIEVPFCGHATIALGAALALEFGDGVFPLVLNQAEISVQGERKGGTVAAALQSPGTRSEVAESELVSEVLALFGLTGADLDERIPVAVADGGAKHVVVALKTRELLRAMSYDLAAGRVLMNREGLATIMLIFAETPQLFHVRNPFASGGVYEDPATGAAAAALGGYLRDLGWSHGGAIDLKQGDDMGVPSRLHVAIPPERGASVRVSGTARVMGPDEVPSSFPNS